MRFKTPPFWDNLKKIFTGLLSSRRSLMEELDGVKNTLSIMEERSRTIEHVLNQNSNLTGIMEERSRTIEHVLNQNSNLTGIMEERSRTIEHVLNQNLFAAQYQIDLIQKWYTELMPIILEIDNNPLFNARQVIVLEADSPFAIESNDYINPESTVEGIVRPTFFVRNCIELLGQEIKCLDLGTGSAGLIFEYAMNRIFAVGVDGSDFCNRYNIGYWPLLKNNLFHCDITKPFNFLTIKEKGIFCFDIITMWEVLEHIKESDLDPLFDNVVKHLTANGYFIGSVSCVEYSGKGGRPYHVTLKSKEWWRDKFLQNGLIMLEDHSFNKNYFCRGVGGRFQDLHNYFSRPEEGFHYVAKKSSIHI